MEKVLSSRYNYRKDIFIRFALDSPGDACDPLQALANNWRVILL